MTDKGYEVVKILLSRYSGFIDLVVGARDKNIENDRYEDIANICKQYHTTFLDRTASYTIKTGYSLSVSWRWMIDTSKTKLIVLHDSLLPRYRGFNPLVTALLNRDEKIGVTALFANEDFDRGDIIAQSWSSISYPIKIQAAISTILTNYTQLALDIADTLTSDKVCPSRPQDETLATYSLWRDDEDYMIPWTESAEYIKRFIDAVGFPYKGASAMLDGTLVRILDADVCEDVTIENRIPGKVIFIKNRSPIVVCGQGLLMLKDAIDDSSGASILPLSKMRTRFKHIP